MAATSKYAIPYPIGTDRVADGDNAMQAIAEKVDTILGVPNTAATLRKSIGQAGWKPAAGQWVGLPGAATNITMSAGGLALVKLAIDISGITGSASLAVRMDARQDTEVFTFEGATRQELRTFTVAYLVAGATTITPYVNTFVTPSAGLTINSVRWDAVAIGGSAALA